MASIKVENNKKKKSGTAAASSANNMTLNEKESGLLMAIASLLGDAPQVDFDAVNDIVGMTYTKNAKSSARKLFVKLGDAETFSGNLSRHEATMLCAVALTLGGPPGVDYDAVARAIGMLHGKNAKVSAKTLFEKLAEHKPSGTITLTKGAANVSVAGLAGGTQTRSQYSAEDTEGGKAHHTPARATRSTPAKNSMPTKKGVGPRGPVKAAPTTKGKKSSTSKNEKTSKGISEQGSVDMLNEDDLYDDEGSGDLRIPDAQGRESVVDGDGEDEDFYSVGQGSIGTQGGDSDQSTLRLGSGADMLEDDDDLDPRPGTSYSQGNEGFEEGVYDYEPRTQYGQQNNPYEEEDYGLEPGADFYSQYAPAMAPQASSNEQTNLTHLAGIVRNAAASQAMPPPPTPVTPRQQVLENNYAVQDPGASASVTPFRHPPPGPIPGLYTIQVLGHLHPVTQNDVDTAAWYNISIEVYMEWRIRNNISALNNGT